MPSLNLSEIRITPQIWVVFRCATDNNGVVVNGIFWLEKQAKAAARFDEGIMLVNVGERLPELMVDVEKTYYPCYTGTWENSPHGRWTRRAQKVLAEFFGGGHGKDETKAV